MSAIPKVATSGRLTTRKAHLKTALIAAVIDTGPLERIARIKAGVPASEAKQLITDLNMGVSATLQALGVSVATLNRKVKNDDVLTKDESERVLGLARLVGQVRTLVEESGDPENFDANGWTARWLTEPLPALGGARPVDFMDTMEGQRLVSDTLAKIQSGAYA
jgi:putative toxin-antitoxin system antitoxin component (TIGR02293 family)